MQDTKKYYTLEVVPLVNRKLKAQVIEYGLVQVVNKMNKAFYKQSLRETMPFPEAIKDSKYDMPFNEAIETYDSLTSSDDGWAMLQEANRVIHANNARKNRVKKRIDALLQKPCVFLTFTFSDKYLHSTSTETRRRYVRHFLDDYGAYVANIDFGSKNGREHYHAILQCSSVDCSLWRYGNLDVKRVLKPNSQAISKYISKLTNHALKETTKGFNIIYSR